MPLAQQASSPSPRHWGVVSRYRHYRVFTTPKPVQFSCIALDTSGEVIAAGCADIFDVYVWSAKSGEPNVYIMFFHTSYIIFLHLIAMLF